jgi:hypothetical protein
VVAGLVLRYPFANTTDQILLMGGVPNQVFPRLWTGITKLLDRGAVWFGGVHPVVTSKDKKKKQEKKEEQRRKAKGSREAKTKKINYSTYIHDYDTNDTSDDDKVVTSDSDDHEKLYVHHSGDEGDDRRRGRPPSNPPLRTCDAPTSPPPSHVLLPGPNEHPPADMERGAYPSLRAWKRSMWTAMRHRRRHNWDGENELNFIRFNDDQTASSTDSNGTRGFLHDGIASQYWRRLAKLCLPIYAEGGWSDTTGQSIMTLLHHVVEAGGPDEGVGVGPYSEVVVGPWNHAGFKCHHLAHGVGRHRRTFPLVKNITRFLDRATRGEAAVEPAPVGQPRSLNRTEMQELLAYAQVGTLGLVTGAGDQ